MTELDDKILADAAKQFGITVEEARKQLQELIEMGLLTPAKDPSMPFDLKLSTDGAKYAEKTIIEKYGEFKKIMDMESGKWHKVPTIVIIREGILQADLKHFPLWSDDG